MKVRRVFFNHHLITAGKVTKLQRDFDVSKSHQECAEAIYGEFGRFEDNPKRRYDPFAEVISSTITEAYRKIEAPFKTPKHFGTDLLLNPVEYAAIQDAKVKVRKSKGVI